MNYRLSSLHLSTAYDDPIQPLVVPGVATKGATSQTLSILDGANRAPHRLARLVRRVGLLGLRVANPGSGVRVTISLIADDLTMEMWSRSHLDEDGEPLLAHDHGHHRLIEVSAQGRTQAVALLVRRPGEEEATYEVTFDVAAGEIGESGSLMFGFEEPGFRPAWAERGLMPDGPVGLCVRNVRVEPVTDEPVPWTVSGGRSRKREPGVVMARPGFFVLNPGGTPGPVQLTLSPRLVPKRPLPRGRRAKLKEPVLRLRDARRAATASMLANRAADVEVVTLSGRTLIHEQVSPERAAYVVRLPVIGEPVYVRAGIQQERGRAPRSIDWSVEATPVRG